MQGLYSGFISKINALPVLSQPRGLFPPAHRHSTRTPTPNPPPRRPKRGGNTNRTQNYAKEEKAQLCSLCLPGEILCILSSDPTSAESDQLGLLCCQPEPVADTSTPLGGFLTASTHWRTICQVRSSHLHASDHMTTATAIPRQVVTGVIPKRANGTLCRERVGEVLRSIEPRRLRSPRVLPACDARFRSKHLPQNSSSKQ